MDARAADGQRPRPGLAAGRFLFRPVARDHRRAAGGGGEAHRRRRGGEKPKRMRRATRPRRRPLGSRERATRRYARQPRKPRRSAPPRSPPPVRRSSICGRRRRPRSSASARPRLLARPIARRGSRSTSPASCLTACRTRSASTALSTGWLEALASLPPRQQGRARRGPGREAERAARSLDDAEMKSCRSAFAKALGRPLDFSVEVDPRPYRRA